MTADAHDVEVRVQYVSDCPHRDVAEERVRAALAKLDRRDITVVLECVRSSAEAEQLAFRGSPTVLLNGHDPFADPGGPIGLSCRCYLTEDGMEGAPSVGQLAAALAATGNAR
jgi:hypothetical protein